MQLPMFRRIAWKKLNVLLVCLALSVFGFFFINFSNFLLVFQLFAFSCHSFLSQFSCNLVSSFLSQFSCNLVSSFLSQFSCNLVSSFLSQFSCNLVSSFLSQFSCNLVSSFLSQFSCNLVSSFLSQFSCNLVSSFLSQLSCNLVSSFPSSYLLRLRVWYLITINLSRLLAALPSTKCLLHMDHSLNQICGILSADCCYPLPPPFDRHLFCCFPLSCKSTGSLQ